MIVGIACVMGKGIPAIKELFALCGYIPAVCVTAFVCVLLHFVISLWRRDKRTFLSDFRKLLYQFKLVTIIWVAGIALLPYLASIFCRGTSQGKLADFLIKHELFIFSIYSIAIFFCAFFLYLSLYYMVDRSVSSKIMITLNNAPEKQLEFEALKKLYDIDQKYQDVLTGMQEGRFVIKKDNKYFCTGKGMFLARVARFIKTALSLGRGG